MPEHADLQGRLQRLICLLRHFAGGRCRRRAEFHLSPAIPPPPPPAAFVSELLINCCVFTPKGCCWGAFDRAGSAAGGGLRRRQEHPQHRAAKPCRRSGTRRCPTESQESPQHPEAPATNREPAFRRSGAGSQLCKALGEHLGRRDAREDGRARASGARARSPGAKHPANFPLPIHQLATCSE